jgi:Tol biopolymer transport system component
MRVVVAAVVVLALAPPAVAHGRDRASAPSWSPDGARLAYVSDAAHATSRDYTDSDVWVMDGDGGRKRNLTRDGRRDDAPDWAPDGRRLAYRSEGVEGSAELRVLEPGARPRTIAITAAAPTAFDWSPVDARIAFTTRGLEIATVDADTEALRVLGRGRNPVWSPAGGHLAFVGADGVYVVRAEGTGLRRVTGGAGDDQPAWSPDARAIVFRRTVDFDNSELFVVDVATGAERRLTFNDDARADFRGGSADWQPAWSPDGSEIAFASGRGGSFDIWSVAPDGTGLRRITATGSLHEEAAPVWSPDSARLALVVERPYWDLDYDVAVVRRDGSDRRNLTLSPRITIVPMGPVRQSRDRRRLWFGVRVLNSVGTARARVRIRADGRDVLEPAARKTNARGLALFSVRVRARGRVAIVLTARAGGLRQQGRFVARR